MLECCADDRTFRVAQGSLAEIQRWSVFIPLLVAAAASSAFGAGDLSGHSSPPPNLRSSLCVTNAAQFRTLSGEDYVAGCNFQLGGVITLVDTNRDLIVLQDASGAVAVHFRFEKLDLQVGQLASLDGTDCCPYFVSFPDYPYRPSGRDVPTSFEAPSNWGQYYLTRMRGWLHPPVTGQYSFWIASDNSSELWMSPNADPSKARKIAFLLRFEWVNQREWSRFPSQHSDTMLLKAGEAYYIEALQEQKNLADHLSVAWQGPGLERSVINGRYLTPWNDGRVAAGTTNGILREFWTNYSAGDLTGLGGARPFLSAITVKKVRASMHGPSPFPKPARFPLDRPLRREDNYRWVEAEGMVEFSARAEGDTAFLDLSDGQSLIQVRVPHCSPEISKHIRNLRIRVQGVCEGVYDAKGTFVPGIIWSPNEDCLTVVESATNTATSIAAPSVTSTATTNRSWQGFYGTRCVVTFNDQVLGNDFIFVQEDSVTMMVNLDQPGFKDHFKVGHWVEIAGDLQPGKYLPVIRPLVVTELGSHSLPLPSAHPLNLPVAESEEGRWSELEGVVHTANTNGTLSVVGKDWHAYFWIGQVSSNRLSRYVDATLRARGTLLLSMLDAPVLLIPSREYLSVEEDAPNDPFGRPRRSIADVLSQAAEIPLPHRVRVAGVVTYRDAQSFIVQDSSGGIRVRPADSPGLDVGNTVEVAAFPTSQGFGRHLVEAITRRTRSSEQVRSTVLDLQQAALSKQNGMLVQVVATVLGESTNAVGQALELQQEKRVFAATLAVGLGNLPQIAPGSRLSVTGILDNETTPASNFGDKPAGPPLLASLNILLRSPHDIAVLSGPPWWTWKRIATLVGTLLTVLMVALLWVHLLRRRLARQKNVQLAFSRKVLERLEEERQRIAANLHDSLGQMLLVINSQAIWASQGAPEEPGWREHLAEIGSATCQAIEEVRRITHGLRPYQLDRLGLTLAIRALVGRASENNPVVFASRVEDIDNLFAKEDEIHVYRIVQEVVSNIIRHSGATEAAVVIKKRPTSISLSIRDNGKGFDAARLFNQPHEVGYGLSGIAERVRILGGTLAIDSRPGEGTNAAVEIPPAVHKNDTGVNSSNR